MVHGSFVGGFMHGSSRPVGSRFSGYSTGFRGEGHVRSFFFFLTLVGMVPDFVVEGRVQAEETEGTSGRCREWKSDILIRV